jgi:putative cell wall-binding protein
MSRISGGEVVTRITTDATGAQAGFSSATQQLSAFGKSASFVRSLFTKAFIPVAVVAGIFRFATNLQRATQEMRSFEQEFSKIARGVAGGFGGKKGLEGQLEGITRSVSAGIQAIEDEKNKRLRNISAEHPAKSIWAAIIGLTPDKLRDSASSQISQLIARGESEKRRVRREAAEEEAKEASERAKKTAEEAVRIRESLLSEPAQLDAEEKRIIAARVAAFGEGTKAEQDAVTDLALANLERIAKRRKELLDELIRDEREQRMRLIEDERDARQRILDDASSQMRSFSQGQLDQITSHVTRLTQIIELRLRAS